MGRSITTQREGGVSTRKQTQSTNLCGKLLRRSPSSEREFGQGFVSTNGGGGGGSRSPPSVAAPQAAWGCGFGTDEIADSGPAAASPSSTALLVAGSSATAPSIVSGSRFGPPANAAIVVACSSPPPMQNERASSSASSASMPVEATEDPDSWEPPASSSGGHPGLRRRSAEADQSTTSFKAARHRSRASPLGALAAPLVAPRGSHSSQVELQATAVRPNLAHSDWGQAEATSSTSQGYFFDAAMGRPSASSSVSTGGRLAESSAGGGAASPSLDSAVRAESSSSPPPGPSSAVARATRRKGSDDEGSVATVLSSLSTAPDASTEPDTITVDESAAAESVPDCLSQTRSESAKNIDMLSTCDGASEPPDSAAAWAAASGGGSGPRCSSEGGGSEADDELIFMLERPFDGLETILEEDDFGEGGACPRSPTKIPSARSINLGHQTRAASSRSICGQSGRVGDPVSRWPLTSPEPLSSELVRTSPCAEVSPCSEGSAGVLSNSFKTSMELS